jgi:putative hydrolase of the HAD superfamily
MPSAPVIAAVVFDLDDTLVDHGGAVAAAIPTWLGALRAADGDGVDRTDAAAALLAAWRDLEREHYSFYLSGGCSYTEQRRRRLRAFLPTAGLAVPDEDDELDAVWVGYQHAYRAAWRPFPDAERCLRGLAPHLRRGVLTNGDGAQQRDKLARTGLTALVGEVVASGDIGVAKPDPAAFAAVCERLGVAPAATAYVGDALDTDAQAACAAGLRGIWLDRGGSGGIPYAPAVRITGLDALPDALA